MLRLFDADAVAAALPFPDLIDALRQGFQVGGELPVRHHHAVPRPGQDPAVLLLMPAWQAGGATGVKVVHIAPGNEALGLPTVQGVYLLFDGPTGTPRAVLDGTALTVRRTAATSAIAAGYLARPDAARLLVVGAGAMAPHLARAHAAVRPIRRIEIWNRTTARAAAVAEDLTAEGLEAVAVTDLERAVGTADVISCCTMSREPLVLGAWLKPGAHVDLVGAFTAEMRETDDAVMRRGTVFVDTFDGALAEGGDVIQAIAAGALERAAIRADLFQLCRGERSGRRSAEEITVFKSVGCALEDLVAARLVVERSVQQ